MKNNSFSEAMENVNKWLGVITIVAAADVVRERLEWWNKQSWWKKPFIKLWWKIQKIGVYFKRKGLELKYFYWHVKSYWDKDDEKYR